MEQCSDIICGMEISMDNEEFTDEYLRPFDEEKDVIQNVYDKMLHSNDIATKDDAFYKYFYNE